jgi:hypothetical protein
LSLLRLYPLPHIIYCFGNAFSLFIEDFPKAIKLIIFIMPTDLELPIREKAFPQPIFHSLLIKALRFNIPVFIEGFEKSMGMAFNGFTYFLDFNCTEIFGVLVSFFQTDENILHNNKHQLKLKDIF